MALRPPAWLSPRLPVCGDLNIATVFEASGNSPTSGPTVRMIGLPGPSGSVPGGHSSFSRRMPTPEPPRPPANSSSAGFQPRTAAVARSIYKTRGRGSFASIVHLFDLFHNNNFVRAERLAVAAVQADLRFALMLVPQNRAKRAGLGAVAAADAQLGFQRTPPPSRSLSASVGQTRAQGGSWQARQTITTKPLRTPPAERMPMQEAASPPSPKRRAQANMQDWHPTQRSASTT
jgi:hypothetical protein